MSVDVTKGVETRGEVVGRVSVFHTHNDGTSGHDIEAVDRSGYGESVGKMHSVRYSYCQDENEEKGVLGSIAGAFASFFK